MADQYYESGSDNPYTTDTSNGGGDWWTQNQPPPPSPSPFPTPTPGAGGNTNQPIDGYVAANPGDPGTYQANGVWYDAQGRPISYGQSFDPQGNHTFLNTPATDQAQGGGGGGITWGGPVAPFDQNANPYPTFTPPPLPDYLQKGFALPSAAELQATPGYMERYQMGLTARDRSAAAHGTILNGGTQKALARYGQDYASGEYGNLVNQKLGERQQQSADYLNLAYGPAWQQNQAAVNQYGQLYRQYQDQFANNRTSQNDYWQQQMDLLNAGLRAASSGSPGTGSQV